MNSQLISYRLAQFMGPAVIVLVLSPFLIPKAYLAMENSQWMPQSVSISFTMLSLLSGWIALWILSWEQRQKKISNDAQIKNIKNQISEIEKKTEDVKNYITLYAKKSKLKVEALAKFEQVLDQNIKKAQKNLEATKKNIELTQKNKENEKNKKLAKKTIDEMENFFKNIKSPEKELPLFDMQKITKIFKTD